MRCDNGGFSDIDLKKEMIDLVSAVRNYARDTLGASDFGVFPQNGEGLGREIGYLALVDGIGREDIYYGYDGDDLLTPSEVTSRMESDLDLFKNAEKLVLTIDYASTPSKIDDAYQRSLGRGYVPYAAVRELDRIYDNGHIPDSTCSHDAAAWTDVGHFLYMLQYGSYADANALITALSQTYYDLIVMDYSFDGRETGRFTAGQIDQLKAKPDGKRRRVIAYLSIGEAEDYRYYWQTGWKAGEPDYIYEENPDWPGNYKVKYWDSRWRAIVLDYLSRIVSAGFDGVYLDVIDAYEFFENE
jgi:cysteinyl-tRNA synthetase